MSHHYTDAWLFRCGDDRYVRELELKKGLEAILKDAHIHVVFGPLAPLGSSLAFRDNAFKKWLVDDQIPKARALGIKNVILIDHLDCGAFALEFGKMSSSEERSKHLELMQLPEAFFTQHAPDMSLSLYLQDFDKFEKIS